MLWHLKEAFPNSSCKIQSSQSKDHRHDHEGDDYFSSPALFAGGIVLDADSDVDADDVVAGASIVVVVVVAVAQCC